MTSVLPWWDDKRLALDIESTGVNPHTDRIVTTSLVYVAGVLRPTHTTWVIDPGIPVPDGAAEIHGWTTEKVKAHPQVRDPGEALYELVGRIALAMNRSPGMPLVLMNAAYDLTMLEAECRRHGVDPLSTRLERGIRPVVDVMVIDKAFDRYRRGGRKLTQLCAHYGVPLGDAHAAYADALAAARLVPRMAAKHPGLRRYTPEQLHDVQVEWRAEQQESLRAYFDKQGTVHDGCCGTWPVHGDCCAPRVAESEQGALL